MVPYQTTAVSWDRLVLPVTIDTNRERTLRLRRKANAMRTFRDQMQISDRQKSGCEVNQVSQILKEYGDLKG